MQLAQVVDTFGQDDQSWLGSAHGTDAARTVTLDVSKFSSTIHYPNGYLPSGIALGLITASGKYGPYDDTASDGRQTLVGFLFTAQRVPTSTSTPVVAPMLDHGKVKSAKLPIQPTNPGAVDANGKADLAGRIQVL
jgi:hypothetical protein